MVMKDWAPAKAKAMLRTAFKDLEVSATQNIYAEGEI